MRHLAVTVLALLVAVLVPAPWAAAEETPVSVSSPTVTGDPVFRGRLVADPGTWQPEEGLTFGYRWLRDGDPVPGATSRGYRLGLADLGRRLSVRVSATDAEGRTGTAVSEPTARVRRAEFEVLTRPSVSGTRRYTRVLTADPGEWSPARHRTSVRWLRDGEVIRGAKHRRYRLQATDVGHRISARVTVRREGYRPGRSRSRPTRAIMHRVPVRRTVTYRIETRGDIAVNRREFRTQVAETYADPRGWRSAGVAFRRVDRGGDFSVVLSEASRVPSFSSVCSAQWSCRVGRYVIINQLRWRQATPSWNGADKSLRGYRHMVLNHETGHWLGHGHLGCPGDGRPAPVMMQQSKGLDGCRHNPWPLGSELWFR